MHSQFLTAKFELITTTIPAIDLSDYGIENIEDIG